MTFGRGDPLVLGVDLGGTRCRMTLCDLAGRRRGTACGPGANPSYAPAAAVAAVAALLPTALDGTGPHAVAAVVLGTTGHAEVSGPAVGDLLTAAWRDAGLRCRVTVRPDCEVAFAAGTAQPCGVVLVAGTGSVAAHVVDRQIAARRGGHGPLLGDEGSGFWLGREAVRGALRAAENGDDPPGGLYADVLAELLGEHRRAPGTDPVALVAEAAAAAHRAGPAGLAGLAGLVCRAAERADPVADRLLDRAADALTETALSAHVAPLDERTTVVLAGGLLAATPLGRRVRERLGVSGATVRIAGDASAGAAWLGVLDLGAPDPRAAHRRLCSGQPPSPDATCG